MLALKEEAAVTIEDADGNAMNIKLIILLGNVELDDQMRSGMSVGEPKAAAEEALGDLWPKMSPEDANFKTALTLTSPL